MSAVDTGVTTAGTGAAGGRGGGTTGAIATTGGGVTIGGTVVGGIIAGKAAARAALEANCRTVEIVGVRACDLHGRDPVNAQATPAGDIDCAIDFGSPPPLGAASSRDHVAKYGTQIFLM